MRLFSERVASVVRRRIKLAARDLKSFALEIDNNRSSKNETRSTYIVAALDFFFLLISVDDELLIAEPRFVESSSSLI